MSSEKRFELKGSVIIDLHNLASVSEYENISSIKQLLNLTETEDLGYGEDDDYSYHTQEHFTLLFLKDNNEIGRYDFGQEDFSKEEVEEFESLVREFLTKRKKKEIFDKLLANSPFLSTNEAWAKTQEIFELYQKEGFDLI